jgi:hypothetical protein
LHTLVHAATLKSSIVADLSAGATTAILSCDVRRHIFAIICGIGLQRAYNGQYSLRNIEKPVRMNPPTWFGMENDTVVA